MKPNFRHRPPVQPKTPWCWRALLRRSLWQRCVLGALLGLVACVALLLTPWGERTAASVVEGALNARLAPLEQRVRIGAVGSLWRGEMVLWSVAVEDRHGEWLFLPYVRVAPSLPGLFPDGGGLFSVRLGRVEIDNADMLRLPLLPVPDQEAAPYRYPERWTFAPRTVGLEVESLRFGAARLGPKGERVYINAHARLKLAHDEINLRVVMDARARPHAPRSLPAPVDLPEDVRQYPRAGRDDAPQTAATATNDTPAPAPAATPATNAAPVGQETPEGYSLLSFDMRKGYIDLRAQARDSLLLRQYFPNIDRMWSRWRVQMHIPAWPPDAERPARLRWALRFGLRTDVLTDRLRASALSGQALWDGRQAIVRDVRLSMPEQEPMLTFRGSAGFAPEHGPGLSGVLEFARLQGLTRMLGLNGPATELDGSVSTQVDIWRGGRHVAWWLAPLPDPTPFAEHSLPGFGAFSPQTVAPADPAPAKGAAGLRASLSPTAMRVRCVVESPYMRVPGGEVRQMQLTINGLSAAADVMQGDEQLFTALGLPRALVGSVDIHADELPGLGASAGVLRWTLSGMHDTGDLRLHLADIGLDATHMKLEGQLTMARERGYKSLWPWADGELHLAVRDPAPMARLWGGTLEGENIDVRLTVDSNGQTQTNPPQERRQSLTMRLDAARFAMPGFAARELSGQGESRHAHALADLSLLTLSGNRALWSQAAEAPDVALGSASLRTGPGTGGPWNWQQGQGTLDIVGEEARFDVRLAGGTEGVVRGVFNLRDRLLQLRRMDLREVVNKKAP